MSTVTQGNTPTTAKGSDSPFIRATGLAARWGYSRSGLYKLIALEDFPEPIYLNGKAPLWRLSEIVAWEESRAAASAAVNDAKAKAKRKALASGATTAATKGGAA